MMKLLIRSISTLVFVIAILAAAAMRYTHTQRLDSGSIAVQIDRTQINADLERIGKLAHSANKWLTLTAAKLPSGDK